MTTITLTEDYNTSDLISDELMRQNLRIGSDFNQLEVDAHLNGARSYCEGETHRSFLPQKWTYQLSWFPPTLYLPKGKIKSIESLKYFDAGGEEQDLTKDTDYRLLGGDDSGFLEPIGGSWPGVDSSRLLPVTVVFIAGFDKVPDSLINAILIKARSTFDTDFEGDKTYEGLLKKHEIFFDPLINEP